MTNKIEHPNQTTYYIIKNGNLVKDYGKITNLNILYSSFEIIKFTDENEYFNELKSNNIEITNV